MPNKRPYERPRRNGQTVDASAMPRPVAPKARTRVVDKTRYEEIIDAAAELFRRKGYAGTSVNDIAEEVGLLKGSLYHYINSKEDLLASVIEAAHQTTAQLVDELHASHADAASKLTRVIEYHLHGIAADLAKVRVFYAEFSRLPGDRFGDVLACRDAYEHAVRDIIRSGQREGTFLPHLDPRLTAAAVLAMLNSVQAWFKPDGPNSIDQIIDAYTDLILRSVGCEFRGVGSTQPRTSVEVTSALAPMKFGEDASPEPTLSETPQRKPTRRAARNLGSARDRETH